MRNASCQAWEDEKTEGEKIQEGLPSVVNIILLWCFLKRQQKEKEKHGFQLLQDNEGTAVSLHVTKQVGRVPGSV